jgi:2-polyprenyl-3-methyl-5-hydroxy-6-metoxy-1,4-benzoquinol methylase
VTAPAALAAQAYRPAEYWEARAQRFAVAGDGLAAVCSYGMPGFYNRLIHICQRRALAPWLRVVPGMRVLDVGCGIGRWSRLLAARGANVTGVDLSPTMIAEAERRAQASGLAGRCRFLVQDSAALEIGGTFDLIVCVTVLQHMLDVGQMRSALNRMALHLAPQGRLVLLKRHLRASRPAATRPYSRRVTAPYTSGSSAPADFGCEPLPVSIRRHSRCGSCPTCRACRALSRSPRSRS